MEEGGRGVIIHPDTAHLNEKNQQKGQKVDTITKDSEEKSDIGEYLNDQKND